MRAAGSCLALLILGACTEAAPTRERTAVDPVAPGREVDAAPVEAEAAASRDAAWADGGVLDAHVLADDAAVSTPQPEADAGDAARPAADAGTDSGDDATPTDAAVTVCAIAVDDTGLPGVRIRIEGSRCIFQSGEGGSFRYRVELARPIAYHVAENLSCGFCGGYGSDPAALVRATVGSDDIRYCATCDVGCCPPDQAGTRELASGSTEGTLEWPGRQWNGPSDTLQPLGAPFPPGPYAVQVQLRVPGVGNATAQLPITVVP